MTLNGVQKIDVDYIGVNFVYIDHKKREVFAFFRDIICVYYDDDENIITFETLYGSIELDLRYIKDIYFYDEYGHSLQFGKRLMNWRYIYE